MFALSGLAIFGMALGLFVILVLLYGVRYIPNDRVGVIEKRWSLKGSVKSGFIVWQAFRDPMTKKVGYRTVAQFTTEELLEQIK